MGASTKIEWTDATWNPIRARNRATGKVGWHCTHASEGCRWCYAEAINKRLGTGLAYKPGHERDIEIFLDERMLMQPLRWRAPRKIFVGSMTDLFGEFVPDEIIDRLFGVMALCPQHTFQVLTKRSARMRRWFNQDRAHTFPAECVAALYVGNPDLARRWPFNQERALGVGERGWPLPNVWLGVSAEDQPNLDGRVTDLVRTPAAVRFVSAEPLLGPLSLRWPAWQEKWDRRAPRDQYDGARLLDWIIVGGESGPHARPMHPDWARSLRDQCQAAGVPFFFKQWGEWAPGDAFDLVSDGPVADQHGHVRNWMSRYVACEDRADRLDAHSFTEHVTDLVYRVGKARAGRLLDGRTWDERPAVPAVRRDAA